MKPFFILSYILINMNTVKISNLWRKIGKGFFIVIVLVVLTYGIFSLLIQPSTTRNWNTDQIITPTIIISTSTISIKNIRDFSYITTSDYMPHYYGKVINRGSVKKVWFIVEPFAQPGFAHTFLSFEFNDGTFLSISVEIRKEVGESFHPIKGVLRQYELMYVIADERDVINLRANYRNDNVFLYPAKISTAKANELFENILTRAKKLEEKPEFYNTLTNTCTTNIVDHINSIAEDRLISLDKRILFPEDSDYYAYELGLLDTTLPKESLREKYQINTLAKEYKDSPLFSKKIRGF